MYSRHRKTASKKFSLKIHCGTEQNLECRCGRGGSLSTCAFEKQKLSRRTEHFFSSKFCTSLPSNDFGGGCTLETVSEEEDKRATTNVQLRFVLFFLLSFLLFCSPCPKTLRFTGESSGEKKSEKKVKNILKRFCPLVVALCECTLETVFRSFPTLGVRPLRGDLGWEVWLRAPCQLGEP